MAHTLMEMENQQRTAAIITKDQITLGQRIGEGAHGSVYEGTWSNIHGSVIIMICLHVCPCVYMCLCVHTFKKKQLMVRSPVGVAIYVRFSVHMQKKAQNVFLYWSSFSTHSASYVVKLTDTINTKPLSDVMFKYTLVVPLPTKLWPVYSRQMFIILHTTLTSYVGIYLCLPK